MTARNKGCSRGKRIYNGPPSKLMNRVYDGLVDRLDVTSLDVWPMLSLYLARTCRVVEIEQDIKIRKVSGKEYYEKLFHELRK